MKSAEFSNFQQVEFENSLQFNDQDDSRLKNKHNAGLTLVWTCHAFLRFIGAHAHIEIHHGLVLWNIL